MSNNIIVPKITKREIPEIGPVSSKDINDTFSENAEDHSVFAERLNSLNISDTTNMDMAMRSIMSLSLANKDAKDREEAAIYQDLIDKNDVTLTMNLHDIQKVSYSNTGGEIPIEKRPFILSEFNKMTLPFKQVVNRFYDTDKDGKMTQLPIKNVDIEDISDVQSDSIDEGKIDNAFNGNNFDKWLYKASYPSNSPVSKVRVQITLEVPTIYLKQANVFYFYPGLDMSTHISQVSLASIGSSFSSIATDIDGKYPYWTVFETKDATRIRIDLETSSYKFINGRKVFMLGAQEFGLQCIEFDQTNHGDENPLDDNQNIACIYNLKIPEVPDYDSPIQRYFEKINNIFPDPAGNTNIRLRIFRDEALVTELYDSWSDSYPINFPASNIDEIYIYTELFFDTSEAVPPELDKFMVRCSLQ